MDFENLPERILVLTKKNECVTITSKPNNYEKNGDKTVTLTEFLSVFIKENIPNCLLDLKKLSILKLTHCQIKDLPIAFENLNLSCLDLSHNELKIVPTCILSGLKKLDSLNLSHNSIKHFDVSPGCVLHIKIVKLNNNLFTNLPKWIIGFQSINLEELNFSNNKATEYNYHKNSFNMDYMKLKKLKLRNSQLIDDDFDFLKCFKCLEYLDVSNKSTKYVNKLYESDNLFVKLKWKELKVLKMNNLAISLFPEGIPWIETLTELYINQNCLSWFPAGIEFLVNLKILDVSQNTLIAVPDEITKLELLEVFLGSGNSIEICPDLSAMPSLKVLDLYDNLLDNVSVNCDMLESFDVDQNYFNATDFPSYEIKKFNLRNKLKNSYLRISEPKCRQEDDSSDSYSTRNDSDEEYANSAFYDRTSVPKFTTIDESEDWDSPAKIWEKNSEIDSEDDAWHGEERICVNKKPKVRKKIYVEDEDWMFEDAEDI